MSWYEKHALPRIVDRMCGTSELHERRVRACEPLEGVVLELGFGSGHNLEHYPAAVTEVVAVEPNDAAWQLAQRRMMDMVGTVGMVGMDTRVVRSEVDAQRLRASDASVDHVLSTFATCTIPDLALAVSEARRVLRPGGEFHFLEHGLAPEPGVRRWQRRVEPIQRRLGGGCHLTRDPAAALEGAGFELVELETGYLPGPAVSRPGAFLYRGRARRS